VIGDTIAQIFTGAPYDVARNMRMSIYGFLVGGPSGHYWHQVSQHLHDRQSVSLWSNPIRIMSGFSYRQRCHLKMSLCCLQFLEANVMPKRPTSRAAIVLKLLVDQLVFAPISTILLFIALETMKGTPEQIPLIIQVRCCGCAEGRRMLVDM